MNESPAVFRNFIEIPEDDNERARLTAMPNQPTEQVRIEHIPGSREGVHILKVTGPLTIYNFFQFQDVTRSDKSPVLIIDMGEVPYMDSAALGSLLGVHVSCEKNNRKYAIVNLPERLRTMFSMAGVKDYLVVYPTVADAEKAFA